MLQFTKSSQVKTVFQKTARRCQPAASPAARRDWRPLEAPGDHGAYAAFSWTKKVARIVSHMVICTKIGLGHRRL